MQPIPSAEPALQPEIEQAVSSPRDIDNTPQPVAVSRHAPIRSADQQSIASVPPTPWLGLPPENSSVSPAQLSASEQDQQSSVSSLPTAHLSASGKKMPRRLFAFISLALLLLLIAGTVAVWQWYRDTVQPAVTTLSLQTNVTYAGLNYRIVKVEQSERFLDDPRSSRTGMLRLSLQVSNPSSQPISQPYSEVARLLLPGGKALSPVTVTAHSELNAGATQRGYLDFIVAAEMLPARLVFQLGRADEAQVLVPLIPHPDLSLYLPKSRTLNATLQYQGLNWTLLSALSETGKDGVQAKKGLRYLTLSLKVSNPLSQIVIPGSPFDYMLLKSPGVSASPQATTLPVSFEAGATAKTATVTFLVPQKADPLSLVLVAQPQNGFDQATQTFSLK
jgi:hypothetical protein